MIAGVFAMTITVAAVVGLIVGLMVGVALGLMGRPRWWTVCLRLPEELHRRLREEAAVAECSLKAEIISRLQASFQQPNRDQVVDAPRL
jgi:Arc-like DNA binding domain